MSALPLPSSSEPTPAPPAPRGVGFITLSEAARRSGLAESTLAAICREKWAAAELARVDSPADGGKRCWFVREDADERFARCKSPEVLPVDWAKLTEKQRATVRQRKRILDDWAAMRAELLGKGYTVQQAMAEFIEAMDGAVSEKTLYRWQQSFQAGGMAGLVDGRLERDGRRDGEEFIAFMKRLYLTPRKLGASACHFHACIKAEEMGWVIPFGVHQARRVLNQIDRKVVAYHQKGPREYAGHDGKTIHRDYTGMASMECIVSDGHDFNVMVEYEGKTVRPLLVSWMDVRSRFIVGYQIIAGSENSDVILAAFRAAVLTHGLPDWVYHDNGKGYCQQGLQGQTKRQRRAGLRPILDFGVFQRLGVKVKHALPYRAKSKLNERFHRTVDERFSKLFETYTGGNTSRKPYDLKDNLNAGKAPTLEAFKAAFADWLVSDYHNRVHEGVDMEGKTPAQLYADNFHVKRTADPDELDLALCKLVRVKVGRDGIKICGITYEAKQLDSLSGREVDAMIDADNVGQVKVFDTAGRSLGVATSIRRVPANATREELREAMASVKRDQKQAKLGKEAGMRLADDMLDRMSRKAQEVARTAPTPEPPVIRIHRTGLQPEMPAIRAAEADERPADDKPDYSRISMAQITAAMRPERKAVS